VTDKRPKLSIMKVKAVSAQTVMSANGHGDEVEEFAYLGSVVSTTSGIRQDVEARQEM